MEEKIYTLTDEGGVEGSDTEGAVGQRMDALLNDGLGLVLKHLGVDLAVNVERQLESKEIIVEDCREGQNPDTSGFYVLQRQKKDVIPVAFIGNVRALEDKIEADLVMFRGEELKG